MTDYDVIVVGCGPAGLYAATELKNKGVQVLGVDKKPDLTKNIRTASGYFIADQEMNGEFIRTEPLGKKTRVHYTRCGFSVDYSAPMEGIHNTHIVSQSGRHLQITSSKKPLFNIFEPQRWLNDRYRAAKQAGVPFATNTLALKVKEVQQGVAVTVRKDGKTSTLTCRKLLASDGLQSRIAHFLGFNRTRAVYGKGPTIEYEMDGVELPFGRGDIFLFGQRNVGLNAAIIIIPSMRGAKAYRIETMSTLPGDNAKKIIEFFTQKGALASWFKKAEIVDKTGAIVTIADPIKVPYKGHILLVSDSAAFGETLYQGATMCGYMAAKAAIKELSGRNGFEEYTKWWNTTFEWNRDPKRKADYTKRALLYRFLTPDELDLLFDLGAKKPLVAEELEANPYDYTNAIVDYFLTLAGLPQSLVAKLKQMRAADMGIWAQLIAKAREESEH